MKIQQIFPKDFPKNKKIRFQYESNFFFDVINEEKENGLGWSFELIKKPFKKKFVKDIYEFLFEDHKENAEYFIIYNDQDVEIGQLSIGLQKFNNRTRIWDIYVSSTYQNQGIGSKLIEFAENKAKEWKSRCLVLEVQSSNYPAIKFYEKNGFNISGFDLNFYSNTDIRKNEVRFEMSKIFK
jgi:ribosomal protein S18 acetylase RimI-like enzyme